MLEQKELVNGFIREEFYDAEGGHSVRAYHTFTEPSLFSKRLRIHLQEILDDFTSLRPGNVVWDVSEKGAPFRGLEVFDFQHAGVFFGREGRNSRAAPSAT